MAGAAANRRQTPVVGDGRESERTTERGSDGNSRGASEEEEEEGSIRFSNLDGRLYLNSGTSRWVPCRL